MPERPPRPPHRYRALVEKIFLERHRPGVAEVVFARDELVAAARELGIDLPKNLGDVIYALRFRMPFPASISATAPAGSEWVLEGVGRARYAFRLSPVARILPNPHRVAIKIPDATPEMVSGYALSDEQALLAVLRYNRLIDVFLGIAAYSLQSHLRTSVRDIGQIEIDEVYVGLDRRGRHYVVPVQAKGGGDKLSPVQTKQDIACCAAKFPDLICRAVSAQFMDDDKIALFELTAEDGTIEIVDEAHYRLVPADAISPEDLRAYGRRQP